jgi:hypothetical protein
MSSILTNNSAMVALQTLHTLLCKPPEHIAPSGVRIISINPESIKTLSTLHLLVSGISPPVSLHISGLMLFSWRMVM